MNLMTIPVKSPADPGMSQPATPEGTNQDPGPFHPCSTHVEFKECCGQPGNPAEICHMHKALKELQFR